MDIYLLRRLNILNFFFLYFQTQCSNTVIGVFAYSNVPCAPKIMLTVDQTSRDPKPPAHTSSVDLSSDQLSLRRIKLRCLGDLKGCLDAIERDTGNSAVRQAFSETCLREMAEQLPANKQEMLNVTEVTERKFSRYNGQRLLQVTSKYREQYDELLKEIDAKRSATPCRGSNQTDNLLATLPSAQKRRPFKRHGRSKRNANGATKKGFQRPRNRFKLMSSNK